jgi:peptidoglycan/LPS O-acetylase OafA/YrhL
MAERHLPVPQHRRFLDRARWVSAAIVATGHALGILNSRLHGSGLINAIADMRGVAVYIFFVLSGYLIGGIVLKDIDQFRFKKYAISRFSRIYIVLIPALLFTMLIDGIALHFFPNSPIYSQVWQGGALGSNAVATRYGLPNFLSSFLTLEPIIGAPIGSAGSLWSLGYEWIFYFAFPALYLLGYKIRGKSGAHGLIMGSIIVTALISRVSAAFWSVWLLGAYASRIRLTEQLLGHKLLGFLKAASFVGILCLLVGAAYVDERIAMIGIGVFGFTFLSTPPLWERELTGSYDPALAGFSYSLYVTHMQCLCMLAAIMYSRGLIPIEGIESAPSVLAYAVVLLVPCGLVAYVFGAVFERRTGDLSKWLTRCLLRTPQRDYFKSSRSSAGSNGQRPD